jgi:Xaa-Pro aminopeptidase
VFESLYQTFEERGGPTNVATRVAELRKKLRAAGVDGFVVPRADEHQNEYVAPGAERLLWLTGFAGSAGTAVVLRDKAALFVDGRYVEQVKAETDPSVFELRHVTEEPPTEWLRRSLGKGEKLGYDPRLHTPGSVAQLASACERAGVELVALEHNPIDGIWTDRPQPPTGTVAVHKARHAGESLASKLSRVQSELVAVDGLVVTDPHNLAWLFNIRGADVAHTPIALGFAYVPKTGVPTLFMDARKLPPSTREALGVHATLASPESLLDHVEKLGHQQLRIRFDAATAPEALTKALESGGGAPEVAADPITLLKAAKNRVELAGARTAHERDGAAFVRFLAWFDAEAPRGRLTEIDAVKALETFRRATGVLKDVSFPTIAAAGPHSATPHYRVSTASNLRIRPGIFLVDSGAQYEDGTTDITRTIALGRPTRLMRDRYTRVLKGHIAIARAIFPAGTTGAQIDVLARGPLWRAGLDFDHGTGHGVGSFLSVHEGPQRIAKTGTTPLLPGMIISNEPGYYLPGSFGIRIENLVAVVPQTIPDGERPMLGFETLTLAPIDLRLVDKTLMDTDEIKWLDAYHQRVRKTLAPLVDSPTRRWLAAATRRLSAIGAH